MMNPSTRWLIEAGALGAPGGPSEDPGRHDVATGILPRSSRDAGCQSTAPPTLPGALLPTSGFPLSGAIQISSAFLYPEDRRMARLDSRFRSLVHRRGASPVVRRLGGRRAESWG